MYRFVGSVFSEDRSVLSLLTADWTFVNERLALHYGIPNVRGDRFRRVQLTDSRRYGLLGKGAFLMGTSYANRTSPVRRGIMDPRADRGHAARMRRRRASKRCWRTPKAMRPHGARAPRGASTREELQCLPRRDRSAGLRARELRRHRRLAGEGPRDAARASIPATPSMA